MLSFSGDDHIVINECAFLDHGLYATPIFKQNFPFDHHVAFKSEVTFYRQGFALNQRRDTVRESGIKQVDLAVKARIEVDGGTVEAPSRI